VENVKFLVFRRVRIITLVTFSCHLFKNVVNASDNIASNIRKNWKG
jgi:hypothetical protein